MLRKKGQEMQDILGLEIEKRWSSSALRFTGVSGERGLLVSLDTEPGLWGAHIDRQNDSRRSFWLFRLGFTVKKNKVNNYVLQDICCDMLA